MGRFEDAMSLVDHAESRLPALRKRYQESLSTQGVSLELRIEVKNVVENLRSALDYVGHSIYAASGGKDPKQNVYFPIARVGAKSDDFPSLCNKSIPGILDGLPSIVPVLASFQAFASRENLWLPDLAAVCNENKHSALVPQTRHERPELDIQSGPVGIRLVGNARITLSGGASIRMGDTVIAGPQSFSAAAGSPQLRGPGSAQRTLWVDFVFEAIGRSALGLVEVAVRGVRNILDSVRQEISS
ncbi:MAG: hypothetical protein ACR2HN_13300 [Tepidiformaceae bacterium]